MKQRKWTLMEQATFLKRIGELLARGYPVAEVTAFIDTIKKTLRIKVFESKKYFQLNLLPVFKYQYQHWLK